MRESDHGKGRVRRSREYRTEAVAVFERVPLKQNGFCETRELQAGAQPLCYQSVIQFWKSLLTKGLPIIEFDELRFRNALGNSEFSKTQRYYCFGNFQFSGAQGYGGFENSASRAPCA